MGDCVNTEEFDMTELPIYIYLTPYFPHPTNWRGGFSLDAVRELKREGKWDVRVIVAGVRDESYDYDGIPVTCFQHRLGPAQALPSFYDGANRRAFRALVARLGLDRPAVVHVHTPSCAVYADEAKRLWPQTQTRLQFHQSGHPLTFACGRFGTLPILSSLQARYYRALIARMDRLVFVSTAQRRRYEADEGTVEDARVEIRYNPIDTALFCPGEKEAHSGFVIGCVANFFRWKHQQTLLDAFRLLLDDPRFQAVRPLRLRFVGTGPELASCRAFVAAQGLDEVVSFEPERLHKDLPAFYRSLDLFVLPSEGEAFGSVCAEARACGVPVVASSDSGFAETFSSAERSRFTCPPGDPRALAQVIAAQIK